MCERVRSSPCPTASQDLTGMNEGESDRRCEGDSDVVVLRG